MKTKDKIILLSIVMGLVCWVIGAEIRHFIDNDLSFLDALIFKISHYDLYMRTLVI